MWNTRRIVLLVIGFAFYLTGYLLYARGFLGGIDGLPALPDIYLPDPTTSDPGIVGPKNEKMVDIKLKMAFGKECEELSRPIKLELHSRNMVLASSQFRFEDDGRVCLVPLSV